MKRPQNRPVLMPLGLLAFAFASLGLSQGCEADVDIGHDDPGGGGSAGSAGTSGSGDSSGAGGRGGTSGQAGAGGTSGQAGAGGTAGQAGAGGSAGRGGQAGGSTKGPCTDLDGNIACGAICQIEGVDSQFTCNEEGKCVQGSVVCGSGLCVGKVCGESCDAGWCDAQSRCVGGTVDCGLPADLCVGKVCGQIVDIPGAPPQSSFCLCDASGKCINGGPIDCGTEACAGLECNDNCLVVQGVGSGGICVNDGRCMTGPLGSSILNCEANPRCVGKACGADCSVEGFDVPLSCNAQGFCVAESVSCEP